MRILPWAHASGTHGNQYGDNTRAKRNKFDDDGEDSGEASPAKRPKRLQFKVVNLNVDEERGELSRTTIFARVCKQYPSSHKIKSWFHEIHGIHLEVEMLQKGYFALHLEHERIAQKLLSKIKLPFNNSHMYMFPWTDDFHPREPTKLLQPVWVRFPGLPLEYREDALTEMGKQLGEFICRADRQGCVPRICVAVAGETELVEELHLKTKEDGEAFVQSVVYEDLEYYAEMETQPSYEEESQAMFISVVKNATD